jgi:filamentous hemagglutinin family protein
MTFFSRVLKVDFHKDRSRMIYPFPSNIGPACASNQSATKSQPRRRKPRWLRYLVLISVLLNRQIIIQVCANPQGATVSHGTATINTQGSQVTIQTSDRTFINWNTFNIGVGETTTFLEPSANSIVWNHINDVNPSQILGELNGNGLVILQNQSGFFIGPHSSINVGGLIMTTSGSIPQNLESSGPWDFDVPPPAASIINYGQIKSALGGPVFLISRDIENHGTISAPEGSIGLYAGKQVLVSERPDGRGLTAQVTLPEGSVDNSGKLIADAGTIALHAQTVNDSGLIQADSVREQNGVIELVASESLNLQNSATIEARGDTQGLSAAGQVLLQSANKFSDNASSTIDVSGGAQGGQGGQVEVSAFSMSSIESKIIGTGGAGSAGGRLLIDPLNITLSSAGDTASSGTINEGDSPDNLTLNVASFATFSQILLQASQNITLSTLWNLGGSVPNSELTLQAGQNINIGNNAGISAGQNWTVNLVAGADFRTPTSVQPGVGGIYMTGATTLQTQTGGSINLFAGKEFVSSSGRITTSGGGAISVQSQEISLSAPWNLADSTAASALNLTAADSITINGGGGILAGKDWGLNLSAGTDATSGQVFTSPQDGIYLGGNSVVQTVNGDMTLTAGNEVQIASGLTSGIRTTGGGNITVTANYGDINAGNDPNGYTFSRNGYKVSPSLGGISTAAGGNVTIDAVNGNVYSFAPTLTSTGDAGCGAFGSQPGNVTVIAGQSIYGHFVAANGTGIISAGQNAGSSTEPFALSLVKGSWNVTAPNGNIFLQEVRNPNGMFNSIPGNNSYLFDYNPLASVTLSAGNEVDLTGAVLPRTPDSVPIIYPPTLNIMAGAGGVVMENDVTLFPSPDGNLNITTTAGGSFQGNSHNLVMSDSGTHQWIPGNSDFSSGDHASTPIQLNNSTPVKIDIAGDMDNLSIWTPKGTEIMIGGNMNSSSFEGQNLHPTDQTTINVAGQIYNRSDYTFDPNNIIIAPGPINPNEYLEVFNAVDANGNRIFPGGNPGFTYNPAISQLGFKGVMSLTVEQQLLQALSGPLYVESGLQPNGLPILVPVTFVSPSVITYFYLNTQNIPSTSQTGYFIGGPGAFNITASSMDLGVTLGIQSIGPRDNNALALLGPGANISLTLTGDLNMFSSRIASFLGGSITINAGGAIKLGSQDILDNSANPRGIFTTGGGDVNVTAEGDVDVQGSRIAAYDGGNVFVESKNGDVNAGNGGAGTLTISGVAVDPKTGEVSAPRVQIAGSGILATTLPDAPLGAQVGNIEVKALNGNIIASQGGIVQDPLNGNETPGPTVKLTAGKTDPNKANAGNIDVSGSGVIGGTVELTAAGNINGLVVSRQNSLINAQQSFSGTVLSGGTANVSAGTSVSGTIIAVNGITASGATVDAGLLSQNVSVGGAKAQGGLASTATASATSQSAVQEENAQNKQAEGDSTAGSSDDDLKRKQSRPLLAKAISRVTVILPPR